MPKEIANKRYTAEFKKQVVEVVMQDGLAVERRDRGSKGIPRKLPKEVEEDLLVEVQRLRAENEYLSRK